MPNTTTLPFTPNPNWAVPCHQCGAGTNEPCRSAHGQIYPGYTHSVRQKLLAVQLPTPHYILMVMMYDPDQKDSVAFQADRMAVEMVMRKWGDVQEG
jgi:hypothetical protein